MAARTALLVDDDLHIAEGLRAMLPWRDVKLEFTANADEAVDCLKTHNYCGLVLNLEMPNRPGRRILDSVRRGVPVVLVASSIPDWVYDLKNADDIKLVMARPFEPSLLASLILGLCGIER